MRTKKSAPLGSGIFYIVELKTDYIPEPSALEALCTDENKAGETTGGAKLTYSADVHKEKDDHGRVTRIITNDEEAKLGGGIFTWEPGFLEKLAATARPFEKDGYKGIKLGGLGNDNGKTYIVIFKQIDPKEGDLFVAMVGTNTAGINLTFSRTATSKLEPEFTGEPCDEEGTLVMIFEKIPQGEPEQGE